MTTPPQTETLRKWRRHCGERGFTMIELIVGLALVVMLAALVTPPLAATIDRERVDQGAKMLTEISAGFAPFHAHINDNPGRLSHLTSVISTSLTNSCGNLYDNADVTQWQGPYYRARVIVANGPLPVFVGTARDLLQRISTAGSNAILGIVVDGVREDDVLALDRRLDGSNGATAGTIRWGSADAEGLFTMTHFTAVSGC